tara:strand:+ start:1939 stop:2145 length:207 start_codon:yes stop_codon:yes gene_type:complete
MTSRKKRINDTFVKLFETLVEAQQLVNTSGSSEDVELKSTYKKPDTERSVKLKLEDTIRDVLGGNEEE